MMRPSWMPSVGDIVFILLLQFILLIIPNFIYGDGSTGWHLVTGQYILEHGQIPRSDLISYTFPDKPWVAYEWLFDAFIAGLDKIGGLKLLAVVCSSAISLLFLLLYEDCRRRGAHFFQAMTLCVMGALISAIHWLVRPHLVTFFAVFIYSRSLQEFVEEKISAKKLFLILSLSMLLWVNCHPAFLMGIVMVVIYLAADFIAWICNSEKQTADLLFKRMKVFALALLLISASTLANPYGIELYKYILEYLHQSVVLSQNDEFSSPVFHGQLQSVLLELFYFALALGLVSTQKKPNLGRFLLVLAFAHLSLSARRNMPLFVIVSLPFIAELLANSRFNCFAGLGNARLAPWLNFLKERWLSIGRTIDETEFSCTRHAIPIAFVLLFAVSCLGDGKALGFQLIKSDFDPKNKPVDVLKCLKEKNLDEKHGLSYDNWGGYIRYKTGMRVFIDDRSDFYGEKFYLEYADAATVQSNWQQVLDKHKIDWILFPNNSLLVANLKTAANWKLLCEDQASCLYVRRSKD
ncbi:MAG: hypothetical protein K2X27_09590 [Candidatus Obscuribacterales bacterium]|nr:hypothetical protein [Candidatus Obscuribacterales bacterium]